ncbi:MAG TPA: FkbM family methyltransferase [Nocardioidaceae bacterium]|nr:FkbM family methyltransferase [Nocardioidaceae bacterium]
MTDRPLRAAVVQLEAVHEEVVSSVFHALLANGVEPTAFLNNRILERADLFSTFTSFADRVHYVPLGGPGDWEALTERLRTFDLLVFNTFQREGQAKLVRKVGIPALGIVHNPRIIVEEPACLDVIRSGELVPLTLAPHVTSSLMAHDPHLFAGTRTLAAWMWDMPESVALPPTARRRITIPGAVDFKNRDYPLILDVLPGLVDKLGTDSFEIGIVGGGRDRARLQELVTDRGLEDVFWFAPLDEETGFVRSDVFYAELARSTFLLPLLPELRRDYRVWKITASVSSSLGFKVPAVMDRWTSLVYDLPAVTYPTGGVAQGLAAAVEMSEDDYQELRARVVERRTKAIESAHREMGLALEASLNPVAVTSYSASTERDDKAAFLSFAAQLLPVSYAQRLQDLWALWESEAVGNGWFVEFGALNGRDFSNTYLLEQLGWSGVVAEPNPGYSDQVRRNRRCYVSTKCVFDKTGETVTFHAVKGRPALSTIEGFGTTDERSDFREEYVAHDVETITLEDLLIEAGAPAELDFLSIDTEGSELPILQAFDFDRFRFRCIAVEHNDVQREALYDLLTSKGYRRKWEDLSGHDDWYVHESAYPHWRPIDVRALTGRLVDVDPFERMYDQRRDLVAEFLDADAPQPPDQPVRVGGDASGKAGAKNRKALRQSDDFLFLRRYLAQVLKVTGVGPKQSNERVRTAYLRMAAKLEPTLAVEVGAKDTWLSRWAAEQPSCQSVELPTTPLDAELPDVGGQRVVVRFGAQAATEEVLRGSNHVLGNAALVWVDVHPSPEQGAWRDVQVVRHLRKLGFTVVLRDARPERYTLVLVRGEVARKPWVARIAAAVVRPVATEQPSFKARVARRLGR